GSMAVPEANRLEGVAPDSGVGVQPGLAGRIVDAFALQHFVQPGQRTAVLGGAAVAVVLLEEAQGAGLVDAPCAVGRALPLEAAQRQHQEEGRVGESMAAWAQAGVAHLTEAQQRCGRLVHASARSWWAAARPALSPSS